jgi:hypothetical protein
VAGRATVDVLEGSLMSSDSNAFPSSRNRAAALLLAAALGSALAGSAGAGEQAHRLRGLFCNTEDQVDEALGHMGRSVPPRVAAELANDDEIVCTYVDLLHFIVEQPLIIGEIPGTPRLLKYEAKLVGVVVGASVRPVSPPAPVFFIARERIPGSVVERRA